MTKQMCTAQFALSFLDRVWFPSLPEKTSLPSVRLLLQVYIHAANGKPLSIKEASLRMGVEDLKTARKHIQRAIETGLIRSQQDPKDHRVLRLLPTATLSTAIKTEMIELQREIGQLKST